jgi:1-acyl-sn-glycerol-3-phosphate acyltransferase
VQDWNLKPAQDLGMPVGERIRSVRRERGTLPWLIHLGLWSVVRSWLNVYHGLKINAREKLPKVGSFVLVSNHCSHLDAIVLSGILPWRMRPDAFPIAAGDTFFKSRVTALLSALFINALPMWRGRAVNHSLADLRQRLADQRCVYIIFPEGTRSRDGTMGRFKSGLGMIVAGTAIPVIPCRLSGTFAAWPAARRVPRPRRVTVKIGPALQFDTISNDRAGWDQIAQSVQAAVAGLE